MSNLSAAVIGTGFIGPVHVEGLLRAGVNVTGVLGSTPEKSQAAAQQLGLSKGYTSLEDLLGDRDVDVVHVTSPNRFHFETSGAAIAAGKHVLCEKPLAMNVSQSGQLVRLARDAGLAAGVNYNIRYYPLCIDAAERVRSGRLGDIFHVAGSYVQDWLFHNTDFNWRVLSEDGGELRAIADIGTH
jgi:predicted dehydrogenase